jgi:hypothetical protein
MSTANDRRDDRYRQDDHNRSGNNRKGQPNGAF